MTALLVVGLLGFSPGIQLADRVDAPRMRVLLVDERSQELDRMNRDQLLEELATVKANKPTLGGPIILMSIGAGLGLLSIPMFLLATDSSGLGTAFLGGLVLTAGGVLLIVGGIMLAVRLIRQGAWQDEMAAIERRVEDQERNLAVPDAPPPPPPPPPPGANLVVPWEGNVVAVF